MDRPPAVSNLFYPAGPDRLRALLSEFMPPLPQGEKESKAYGVVVPHAGYRYSGQVAGALYRLIQLPVHVVLLGPNHTGRGVPFSLWPGGTWQTPLGSVPIHSTFNQTWKKYAPFIEEDGLAHQEEHSLEVQLPFLQYRRPEITISALVIGSEHLEKLRSLGHALAQAIRDYIQNSSTPYYEEVLVVASSDMTHYEPHERVLEKDRWAIERILELDEEGLYHVVHRRGVTMCGYAPTVAMLTCVKELGARRAELIDHKTSASAGGDPHSTVGYASLTLV